MILELLKIEASECTYVDTSKILLIIIVMTQESNATASALKAVSHCHTKIFFKHFSMNI